MTGTRALRKGAGTAAALLTIAVALVLPGSAAAAETINVRPVADLANSNWTATPAGSAWSALDDNVVPPTVPSGGDRVEARPPGATLDLAMDFGALADRRVLSAKAWVYTSTSSSVTVTVDIAGTTLGKVTTGAVGWHSINLFGGPMEITGAYAKNNTFRLRLQSNGGKVEAALVEASAEPMAPKVYWGAWIDGDVYSPGGSDAPWGTETWNQFETNAGNKKVSLLHYGQPAPWNQEFAPGTLELITKRGAIPLMDMDSDGVPLSTLATALAPEAPPNTYKSAFEDWAEDVAANGRPFFFRWMWEMNGTWYHYGAEAASNPSLYVQVWRQLHDIAEAKGATNLTWVWCPNTIYSGSTPLASLYPESAEHPNYVDWTCVDGYNRGFNPIQPEGWKPFNNVFSPTYATLLSLAPNKPVMIAETASTETGGSKSSWITDAFAKQLPILFPKVKAIAWFNWNIPEKSGKWDWQIESSESARKAFAEGIASPYYASNTFGSLPLGTKVQALP